jgi:hypothetical protein
MSAVGQLLPQVPAQSPAPRRRASRLSGHPLLTASGWRDAFGGRGAYVEKPKLLGRTYGQSRKPGAYSFNQIEFEGRHLWLDLCKYENGTVPASDAYFIL